MGSRIEIHQVDRPILGRVSTRRTLDGAVVIEVARGDATRDLVDALRKALVDVEWGASSPVVRCHSADQETLVEIDTSPWLVSIYLMRGAATQDLADELGAHLTTALRHT